jgi:hypothetical protein
MWDHGSLILWQGDVVVPAAYASVADQKMSLFDSF